MSFPYLENEEHKKSVPTLAFVTSVNNLALLGKAAQGFPDVLDAISVIKELCPTIAASQTPGTYLRALQTNSGKDLVYTILTCANFNPSLADASLSVPESVFQSQLKNSSVMLKAIKTINQFVDEHIPPSDRKQVMLEESPIRRHKMLVKNVTNKTWSVDTYGHAEKSLSGVGFVLYACTPNRDLEGFWTGSGDLSTNIAKAKSYESAEAAAYAMRNHSSFAQWQIVEISVGIKSLGPVIDCPKHCFSSDLSAGSLPEWMAAMQRRDLEEALKNHSKEEIMSRWDEINSQVSPKRKM